MIKRIKLLVTILAVTIFGVACFIFLPKIFGEVAYPLEYRDSIRKYANEFNLDPNFVAAVIYTESRFHIDSVSGPGARGLMQLMPATAKGLAERLGLEYNVDMLYDPDYNIHLGTKYLREQMDNYNGNVDLVLASYNAGGGRATAWQLYGEALPRETVGFIYKVKSVKEMYDKIYGHWYNDIEVRKPSPFYSGINNFESFVQDLFTGGK